MGDKFDLYREALVLETKTDWPKDLGDIPTEEQKRLAERLHAEADKAADLNYDRLTTGFCRRIVVTPEDLQRFKQGERVPNKERADV